MILFRPMKNVKVSVLPFLVLLVVTLSGSVGLRAAPLTLAEIREQLSQIFGDPAFERAIWAVKVQSAVSGEIWFEKNAQTLVMPASNMKLLTASAAWNRFGPEFRFETRVLAEGEIGDGRLNGNLVVVGSGDPSLGARLNASDQEDLATGDPLATFREWALLLKQSGVRQIDGDLVGDDSIFDRIPLGAGWGWDELPYGYSSEVGGLQFNENLVLARIRAQRAGEAPVIELLPATTYVQVENQLQTVAQFEESDFEVERRAGTNQFIFRGTVRESSRPLWRSISVDDPTLFFLHVLRETLENEGIKVSGGPVRRSGPTSSPGGRELFVHRSPDLRWVLRVLLKVSQNLYAETMVKLLDEHPSGKSYDAGRGQVERRLTQIGIPEDAYSLADGSGLSRYNFLTAEALVRLLREVYRQPDGEEFIGLLPVAGADGTLSGRLKGTPAEGNVRAKTGTLSSVRALSGYVTTQDGEILVFSMIVNNFLQPRRSAEYLQDLALEFLVSVQRR